MAYFAKCRVCICSLDASLSYDMRKLPLLAHKFVTCTDLSVSEEEPRVPSELCQECCDQLEQLYDFRTKCIVADTKWRMEILAFCNEEEEFDEEEAPHSPSQSDQVESLEQQEEEPDEEKSICDTQPTHVEIELLEDETLEDDTAEEVELDEDEDQHSSLEPPKNIYKCDICSTQFLNKQRLLTHKRRHGELPYPCPEPGCGRGYSHKHTLTLHMRKCHNLGKEHKSHICEYCGKVFDTMSQLRNHRFTHKDKSELPYACEEADCGRRFSSKQLLKVHMMRHAGIRNYTCSYCGVQKTTRTELKIHLNYHTLERTYNCRFCSKVCYSSSNLNKHMRTVHERARNYTCSHCDRTFTQLAICKQHELIHTGEKPHKCEECGKHFRQKAALRTHHKIHTRQLEELPTEPADYEEVAEDYEVEYA